MIEELEYLHSKYSKGVAHHHKLETNMLTPVSASNLIELANQLDPLFIADLGSGFSSIILRKYFPGAFVLTVDKNGEWNDIVSRDCKNLNIKSYGFTTLDEFLTTPSSFNMLFIDMNKEDNISYFDEYIYKVKRSGYLIFNNWEDGMYRKNMIMKLNRYGYNYNKHTRLDEYQRQMAYAWR